jgi:hypothetical protein
VANYARRRYGFLARGALSDGDVLESAFTNSEGIQWTGCSARLRWLGGDSDEQGDLASALGEGPGYCRRLTYERTYEAGTESGVARLSTFGRIARLRVDGSSQVIAIGLVTVLRRRILRFIVLPSVLATIVTSAIGSAIVGPMFR